jgi:hypothetical protein
MIRIQAQCFAALLDGLLELANKRIIQSQGVPRRPVARIGLLPKLCCFNLFLHFSRYKAVVSRVDIEPLQFIDPVS